MKLTTYTVWILVFSLSACTKSLVNIEAYSVSSELTLAYQDSQNKVSQLSIVPEIEAGLGEEVNLTASFRLRLDASNDLTPGEPSLDNYSSFSKPITLSDSGTVELRDFYIDYEFKSVDFRIGKQQIVWGELEGFKNLDIINPQSFREFILDDFDNSRISLWAFNSSFDLFGWNTDMFWSPDSSVHEIPSPEATFGLSAPRFNFNANSLNLSNIIINYPENNSSNAAYGIRFKKYLKSGFDVALSYVSGIDHSPVAYTINETIERRQLIQEYRDRDVWGLNITKAINSIVFRAEFGYRPKKSFSVISNNSLFIDERDQTVAAIGIDIDGPGRWFTNIQYLYDKVEDGDNSLVRPLEDKITTIYTRHSWLNETLFFDIKWYSTNSFSDGLVKPEIRYLINDNISASLGADAFYGDSDGTFGQFKNNDRVVFKLQHIF